MEFLYQVKSVADNDVKIADFKSLKISADYNSGRKWLFIHFTEVSTLKIDMLVYHIESKDSEDMEIEYACCLA